jgi:outer membrane usher protein
VIVSPQTGDTLAIVEAKDAVGARVATAPGVRIDHFGHALIGGMEPYSQNAIDIDTKGLPLGVQLKSTEQRFAPTAGSVVRVRFDTENRGQAVVMRLRRLNGEPVPFGTDLLDDQGNTVGTVSQGSRAMFFGKSQEGELTAKWGADIQQSCKVRYALPVPDASKRGSPIYADAVCQ